MIDYYDNHSVPEISIDSQRQNNIDDLAQSLCNYYQVKERGRLKDKLFHL